MFFCCGGAQVPPVRTSPRCPDGLVSNPAAGGCIDAIEHSTLVHFGSTFLPGTQKIPRIEQLCEERPDDQKLCSTSQYAAAYDETSGSGLVPGVDIFVTHINHPHLPSVFVSLLHMQRISNLHCSLPPVVP